MRRPALSILACPQCCGPLKLAEAGADDVVEGTLVCEREAILFPVIAGVPRLVRPDAAPGLEAFAFSYSSAWRKAGWGSLGPDTLLALPYQDRSGRQRSGWRMKARSMDALMLFLEARASSRILDLGCGVGWLSYHLARKGCQVYAVDAILDEVLGLGAADAYLRAGVYFERIWGEIERPPFQDASFDAVVCNASLHYVDSVRNALAEISRILAPNGAFVLMNSPVHHDLRSARGAERGARARLARLGATPEVAAAYHHFTFDELRDAFELAFGHLNEHPWDPGFTFRLIRRLKGLALRMELAEFPILWASKG